VDVHDCMHVCVCVCVWDIFEILKEVGLGECCSFGGLN